MPVCTHAFGTTVCKYSGWLGVSNTPRSLGDRLHEPRPLFPWLEAAVWIPAALGREDCITVELLLQADLAGCLSDCQPGHRFICRDRMDSTPIIMALFKSLFSLYLQSHSKIARRKKIVEELNINLWGSISPFPRAKFVFSG